MGRRASPRRSRGQLMRPGSSWWFGRRATKLAISTSTALGLHADPGGAGFVALYDFHPGPGPEWYRRRTRPRPRRNAPRSGGHRTRALVSYLVTFGDKLHRIRPSDRSFVVVPAFLAGLLLRR